MSNAVSQIVSRPCLPKIARPARAQEGFNSGKKPRHFLNLRNGAVGELDARRMQTARLIFTCTFLIM
jgi:hypothetical protein